MKNVLVYIWVDPNDLFYLLNILEILEENPDYRWRPADIQFSKTFASSWIQVGIPSDLYMVFNSSIIRNRF